MTSVRRSPFPQRLRQRALIVIRALRTPFLTQALRALVVTGVLALSLSGCGPGTPGSSPSSRLAPPEIFRESAEASGVRFRHENGRNGEFYYPEIIGPGVALLDYDNDGKLDILVLQGTPLAPGSVAAASGDCSARLYRNELAMKTDGGRELRFTDVTQASGLCSRGYGMGVAVGDYDNDGCIDVFITHFAAGNQLFRNNCNGTFTDVTQKAGVAGAARWGVSSSFVDYDRDGLLDLYVANYVDYAIGANKRCFNSTGARDYCAPSTYKPVPGILYRNRGDGTFEDVSVKSGIAREYGSALGVIALDVNRDGWPDIYVANDGNPNQLWINQKDGTFKNEADIRGCAVNIDGAPEAGMGIDAADVSGRGLEDIFITHLTREKATLYVNVGDGRFEDRSAAVGLATATSPYTGFGTAFLDYDNDGWMDIVIANGAVHSIQTLVEARDPDPLHQKKQLFHNAGNGTFAETSSSAGAAFELSEVGRGLAAGDLDNDGRIDVVVSNNNGPLRILMNRVAGDLPWFGVRLLVGKRDAYGAMMEVRRGKGPTLWRRVHADGSYLSASDARVLVGLGASPAVDSLVVHWPDGRHERFLAPPLNRYTTLTEGTGSMQAGP